MAEKIKKRGFHMTMYSAVVLLLLVCGILGFGKKDKNPLLQAGAETTLYVYTQTGVEPEISINSYFQDAKVDESKVTYDFSGCSWDQEGTYMAPVYYDGKLTGFVMEIKVGDEDPVRVDPDRDDNSMLAAPAA